MQQKIAIFIDFDNTLFDSGGLWYDRFTHAFEDIGISEKVWRDSYMSIRGLGYALDRHMDAIEKELGKPIARDVIRERVDAALRDPANTFSDAIPFLEKARASSALLHVVTRGIPEWQHYKLEKTGLGRFFTHIHAVDENGSKADAIAQHLAHHDRVLFIDDRQKELDMIQSAHPHVETYWIQRTGDEQSSKHKVIRSLKDINI